MKNRQLEQRRGGLARRRQRLDVMRLAAASQDCALGKSKADYASKTDRLVVAWKDALVLVVSRQIVVMVNGDKWQILRRRRLRLVERAR